MNQFKGKIKLIQNKKVGNKIQIKIFFFETLLLSQCSTAFDKSDMRVETVNNNMIKLI